MVFWETTAGCNLACVHCRRSQATQQRQSGELTTADATTFIRSLASLGSPVLVFSGGEPLQRPDLFELLAIARDAGVPAALATNGTMIDDGIAQQIAASGVRRVSISFDAADAASHDQFRGVRGAFDASIRGFTALRSAGVPMQINTSVARHNFQRLDEMHELAVALGAEALHLFMLVPVGCGLGLSDESLLSPAEYEATLDWLCDRTAIGSISMRATCAPQIVRVASDWKRKHNDKQSDPASLARVSELARSGCLAGRSVCFVSHRGEVYPCGYLPWSAGNVRDTTLSTIWSASDLFAKLRDPAALQGKCSCCEFGKVCRGCRARALGVTGNVLSQEPACDHQPRMRK
jgi:radical SAM protein with 4Fe4S-binding SPASM domain